MGEIEYERQHDIDARMRAEYKSRKGQITSFIIQLEVLFKDEWKPVVRYDTAHGFAHRDLYHRSDRTTKTELNMSFNDALTYALNDIRDNWELYRRNFLGR
ncbi:MAG: DUF7718 family protein [Thermodesulfobacteriota bacterium]